MYYTGTDIMYCTITSSQWRRYAIVMPFEHPGVVAKFKVVQRGAIYAHRVKENNIPGGT